MNECLKNINMEFERGYMYAVVGPSGTGKTTLFSSLLGFTRGSGSIRVGNHFDHYYFMNHISSYFPSEYEITNYLRIYDYAKKIDKLASNFSIKVFMSYIKKFKLPDKNIIYTKCSKGQKALIDIAYTLTYDTDIYILDEPFSNVDYVLKSEVMKCLKEKVVEGKTVILSSHNIKILEGSVDYIYFMKNKTNLDIVDTSKIEDKVEIIYRDIYKEEVVEDDRGI